MIVIVGGTAQGKLEYAKKIIKSNPYIIDENYTSIEELRKADVINHFHEIIKRLMQEEEANKNLQASKKSVEEICFEIIQDNKQVCIVCDEIGYGIVPIDAFQRAYRERTGRILCEIAKKADEVHRVVCGIGTKIK